MIFFLMFVALVVGSVTASTGNPLIKEQAKVNGSIKHRRAELLNQHVDTFELSVGIGDLTKDAQPGLRSVSLHVLPGLREAHATWPNGQPISADSIISTSSARSIIGKLKEHGILDAAGKFYSNRAAKPKSMPPADAKPYKVEATLEGLTCSVRVTFFDEDWHTYLEEYIEPQPMLQLLSKIAKVVDTDNARSIVSGLRSELANSPTRKQ